MLLATWRRGGHNEDERIVADHLRWLFLRCERPDGRWARSHYPDGRPKGPTGQADQQLYPLLELADYVEVTGRTPALPPEAAWSELIRVAWSATENAIDTDTGLIRTTETPAGDEPTYPFLLSDQVLLWHVASRLAPVAAGLGIDVATMRDAATRVREAVQERFVSDGPLGQQWAYSINGRGGAERDMDAADLPIALAPLWGFCKPTDQLWRTSIQFAFDPENPAYVAGPVGGLGSRHTPGTWTLGDIMGWVAFGLMEDQEAADAALDRLVGTAFSDGMLPEAYDPEGSGSVVRHWFAWPGAALGALVLEHAARQSGA
jgi:meiotically up-regulated gene 157 (Mug157) protein